MHIPDGFVSSQINAATFAVTVGVGALAVIKAKKTLNDRQIPLLGITAAFVFAAQMLNFPIAGGTSGHFLGALLAALLLGPLNGFLVMCIVLITQCLLFADGGIVSLGTNIFNMGIVAGLGGYAVYRFLLTISVLFYRKKNESAGEWTGADKKPDIKVLPAHSNHSRWMLPSIAVASWVSVVAASAVCSLELALSGTSPMAIVLPAMVGVHSLIGIGEAVITVGVVSIVFAARPELLNNGKGKISL